VRATLAAWAAELVCGVAAVRLLRPQSLHLTLCFLGEIELRQVPALAGAIREVVGETETGEPPSASDGVEMRAGERVGERVGGPIVLAPAEALALPSRRPRVLALGLRDVDGHAAVLQGALAARLQAGDWYAPQGRPWLPHVTLARAGRAGGAGRAGRPAGAGGAAGSAAGSVQGSDLGSVQGSDLRALASAGSVQGSDLRALASAGSVQGSDLRALASAGLPPVELHPFTPEGVALLRSWPGSRYELLARTALRVPTGPSARED
jgi:2'-5' RNA ligase